MLRPVESARPRESRPRLAAEEPAAPGGVHFFSLAPTLLGSGPKMEPRTSELSVGVATADLGVVGSGSFEPTPFSRSRSWSKMSLL